MKKLMGLGILVLALVGLVAVSMRRHAARMGGPEE